MIIPFLVFWILLFVARQELQIKGIAICIALWIGLLVGFMTLGISPYFFVAAQALLDVGMIVFVFGGDIRIS